MANQEHDPTSNQASRPSSHPWSLPPELVEAIKHQVDACVSAPSDEGTVYVIKAPAPEIEGLRGPIPILLRHELHTHAAAPVIRTVLLLYDQPARPLALETFINIADPGQRHDFAALSAQQELPLLFYDEMFQLRLSKRLPNRTRVTIPQILRQAESLLAAIPRTRLDFDRAKAELMRQVGWPPSP